MGCPGIVGCYIWLVDKVKKPEKPSKAARAEVPTVRLTPKQERFAQEYVKCGNASAAYRVAYNAENMKPETINRKAFDLIQNGKIAARVKELQAGAANRAMMTASDVLKVAMSLARFDIRKLYNADGSPIPIHQLDDETAAAVQAVDIHEEYLGSGEDRVFVGYTKKYKVADKNSALEKLFKHFGLFAEDNAQRNPFAEMTDEMLDKVIAAKAAEAGVRLH